jgi:two-component system, LytTR family, sensor histidine kinase AlgZ
LLWLVVTCALKKPLGRLPRQAQYAAGAVLGAVSALYGCGLLRLTGVLGTAPWLASAVAGAFIAGMVMAAMVLRARGQTPAAMTARLEELQSRIRPHFLFNTLNSAIALVREEPAKAETMLEDLAELFRQALADPGESGTLADEIALAERYLAIEQVRFGDRLRIRWDLDAAASSARLPPLLLQPLVENAIKYGVARKSGPGHVDIRARREGDKLVLEVRDDGAGLTEDALTALQKGIGVSTTRARLQHLFGAEYRFEFHRLAQGLAVVVALPWRHASGAAQMADGAADSSDNLTGVLNGQSPAAAWPPLSTS